MNFNIQLQCCLFIHKYLNFTGYGGVCCGFSDSFSCRGCRFRYSHVDFNCRARTFAGWNLLNKNPLWSWTFLWDNYCLLVTINSYSFCVSGFFGYDNGIILLVGNLEGLCNSSGFWNLLSLWLRFWMLNFNSLLVFLYRLNLFISFCEIIRKNALATSMFNNNILILLTTITKYDEYPHLALLNKVFHDGVARSDNSEDILVIMKQSVAIFRQILV